MMLALSSCASKSANQVMAERQALARPRAAAYAADGFYKDAEFPNEKYPRPSDFFFKHCDLSGRNPYPNTGDWSCSEPK